MIDIGYFKDSDLKELAELKIDNQRIAILWRRDGKVTLQFHADEVRGIKNVKEFNKWLLDSIRNQFDLY